MRSAICTFATFSLFLFSLMSCDSTKPDSNDYVKPGYGAVDGKLVDGNNKPQSGWIFILGYNSIALSDTTGSFYLNNVPVGAHTVYINFDDGPSRRLQVTVDDGKVVHLGDVKPGEDNVNGNESNRHYGANYNWSRAGESYPYGNYLNQFYSNDDTNSLPIEILTNDTLLSKIGCYYYSSYEGYRSELPYYIMMDNQKVCEGFTKKFIAYNKIIVPTGAHKIKVFVDSVLMFFMPVLNTKGMSNVLTLSLDNRLDNSCDLDLMLVNGAGDTCSFRNPKPDWGIKNSTDDNPSHSGDEQSFYSDNKEEIIIPNPSEASYTIIVKNFVDTNKVNSSYYNTSTTALPSIKAVWGTKDTLMLLDSLRANNVKIVNIRK